MIKLMLTILGLTLGLTAFCQESDTLTLKIRNRVIGQPTVKKNFQLEWRADEPGQPYNRLDLNTDLQGESYNETWLWQTYNFNGAKGMQLLSPKLPAGCEPSYMMLSSAKGKDDFHMVLGFDGTSCIALGELLTKEKIKILFTDVPVYEENTTKDKLYLLIDDLHNSHITTEAVTKKYEDFVNSTDHKKFATYASFDFPVPKSFDSCEKVSIGTIQGSIMDIGGIANELISKFDIIYYIRTTGELTDRIQHLADPTGLGFVKRCVIEKQFLSPVPRNGLLKDATSELYFSLTNNFKMLLQTNKHD